MRQVIDQVMESITQPSKSQAGAAADMLRDRGLNSGTVSDWAIRLAGARHSTSPRTTDKLIAVVASDHGLADPGINLGRESPTLIAIEELAAGAAAANTAARSSGAPLVLIDAGIRGAGPLTLDDSVLRFRHGDGTEAIDSQPAMTLPTAVQAVQTGIALTCSFADNGLDVLGMGSIGLGSLPSSAALIAALTDRSTSEVAEDEDLSLVQAARALAMPPSSDPIEVLSNLGGFEHALMTGMILAAASIHIPVILDGHTTMAAALVAHALCRQSAGYLFASHAGANRAHRCALESLQMQPLYAQAIGHGEGIGPALAFPMLDTAAGLLAG